MNLRRNVAALGVAALFALPLSGVAQGQEQYKVRLATVPMDGGMRNTVAGSGSATAVLTGTKLAVNGTFDGLLSPATIADVHRGPAMGVRGPSFAVLTVSRAPKGTLSGSIDLTAEQVQALRKGRLYLQ